MCLILTAINPNSEFKLILASNRDEFYERPTKNMFWRSDKSILSGEDELKKGMWLGLNKNGSLAAVTNVRDFSDDEALNQPEKKRIQRRSSKKFPRGKHIFKRLFK
ncbi:NRDE family protein [SAR86 cluster bacterium]|nr:NRDE family protein [SAR86 cluster bacterium]